MHLHYAGSSVAHIELLCSTAQAHLSQLSSAQVSVSMMGVSDDMKH